MGLIEALGVLALLLVSAGVLAWSLGQDRQIAALQIRQLRAMALASEAAHARLMQQRMDSFQDQAAGTLDASTRAARATHRAIADIPFDILEQIPATRASAKHIRRVHDLAADGLYAGLGLYARWRQQRRRD